MSRLGAQEKATLHKIVHKVQAITMPNTCTPIDLARYLLLEGRHVRPAASPYARPALGRTARYWCQSGKA